MRLSCMFLVSLSCSVFGMQKPSDDEALQIVDASASHEIFNVARNAACSGYFKRLESLLENHSFDEKQKSYLLYHTIGSKGIGKEYIDCFALLLLHGARVDKPVDYDELRAPLQLIDEGIYSKKYTQLALVFRAGIGQDTLTRLAGMVRDQSNSVDSLDAFYKPRVKLVREALNACDTLQDAVRREDMNALKELLSQLKKRSVHEQDSQLWQALDTAIALEKTEMIDELVAHGAPIKTCLDYRFFDRLDVLKHCVSKRYVTPEDLDRYATQIPKEYHIGYSSMTEEEFTAAKATAAQILMESKKVLAPKRLLSLDEPDIKVETKVARVLEKKDE